MEKACPEYDHWFACEIEGYRTFVSEYLVRENRLLVDYNPTEMVAEAGAEFRLVSVCGEWLYVENPTSQEAGWLPASKMVSI